MYKYTHGGDIYADNKYKSVKNGELLDFSANINPLGIPAEVKQALHSAVANCEYYPDPFCRRLVQGLAKEHHLREEHIYIGNGASDVLFRLVAGLRPRKALLCAPTFSDYEKALRTVTCEIYYYNLQKNNEFNLDEAYLEQLEQGLDLAVLCNPNNPTGQTVDRGLLQRILEKCRRYGIKLLVDECFLDFVQEADGLSLVKELKFYPNLIILKAFTKTYAIPGVRLGYCLCGDTEIPQLCRISGQDWNVSVLAQAAGLAALREKDYLRESLAYIEREKEYLKKELAALKIRVYGSAANYLFIEVPELPELAAETEKYGIILRDCANYRGLGRGFFRLAVRKRQDNEKLIRVLKDIVKK